MTRLRPPHRTLPALLVLVLWPIAAAFCLAMLLAWLGPQLDNAVEDHSGEFAQADALQDAQRAADRQQRFERAAQRVCGPQGTVQLLADGVTVQCRNKRGAPTVTAQVLP